jgi:hypothetical protein
MHQPLKNGLGHPRCTIVEMTPTVFGLNPRRGLDDAVGIVESKFAFP